MVGLEKIYSHHLFSAGCVSKPHWYGGWHLRIESSRVDTGLLSLYKYSIAIFQLFVGVFLVVGRAEIR